MKVGGVKDEAAGEGPVGGHDDGLPPRDVERRLEGHPPERRQHLRAGRTPQSTMALTQENNVRNHINDEEHNVENDF